MLQRIQTLYIALAVVLLVLCCCMPLATFEPQGMGFPSSMYTLVVVSGSGAIESYYPILLFFITICAEVALVFALLSYKHRRRQMTLCSAAIVLQLLWVIAYAVLCFALRKDTALHTKIAAFFPLAAIILTLLARRGIKKDEALVRSADRIR